MRIFETDIKKLALLLLPTFLRKPAIEAFLHAIVAPLVWLQEKFSLNRLSNLYYLGITPQVCYLEKLLNDRYDPDARRIFISDGYWRNTHYIYRPLEQISEALCLQSENSPIPLYLTSELGLYSSAFVVHIPMDLQPLAAEITTMTKKFKLPGKTFSMIVIL